LRRRLRSVRGKTGASEEASAEVSQGSTDVNACAGHIASEAGQFLPAAGSDGQHRTAGNLGDLEVDTDRCLAVARSRSAIGGRQVAISLDWLGTYSVPPTAVHHCATPHVRAQLSEGLGK